MSCIPASWLSTLNPTPIYPKSQNLVKFKKLPHSHTYPQEMDCISCFIVSMWRGLPKMSLFPERETPRKTPIPRNIRRNGLWSQVEAYPSTAFCRPPFSCQSYQLMSMCVFLYCFRAFQSASIHANSRRRQLDGIIKLLPVYAIIKY